MDMIANELSISKRTIYEYFENKEMLVLTCLGIFSKDLEAKFVEKKNTSTNSLEYLLNVFYVNVQVFRIVHVKFFKDIKRMFPNIQNEVEAKERKSIEEFGDVLKKAQEEGYIRTIYNIEILKKIFYMMILSLKDTSYYNFEQYPFSEVFWTNSELFFRGIVTEKGLKLIENFNAKK